MPMYPSLEGKVACITGAGRQGGIGAAIAHRLAQEGCKVVISDIGASKGATTPTRMIGSSAGLEQVAADISAAGGEVCVAVCDVMLETDLIALCKRAQDRFGGLDILINNAGIGYLMEPLTEMDQETWDTVLGVNLRGAFLATKHAARMMIEQGRGGRVVNIASQAAKTGFPFAAAYTSSKHGLIGLTRVSAIELGPHNITVNAICPNHITTGLGQWQNEYFSAAFGKTVDQYLADMKSRIPLGRPGLTEDIAKTCAYLCSDQAAYITGEAMNVSGGEETH